MAYVTRCPYCGSVWLVPDKETADRTPLKCPDCRHSFDATCSLLKVPDELFPGRVAVALFPTGTAVTGRRPAASAAPASSVIPTAPILSSAAPAGLQDSTQPVAQPTAPARPADALDAPVFTARPVVAETTAAEPDSALSSDAAPILDDVSPDPTDVAAVESPVVETPAAPAPEPVAQPVITPEEEPVEEEPALVSEPEPQPAAPTAPATPAPEPEPEPEAMEAPQAKDEEPAAQTEDEPQQEPEEAQESDEPAAPATETPKKPVEPKLSPVMTPHVLTGEKSREATALALMQAPQLSAEPRLGNLSGLKKAVAQEKLAPVTRLPRVTAGAPASPAAAPMPHSLRTPKKKSSAGSFILVLILFAVIASVAAIIFNQQVMQTLPQTAPYYNQICSKGVIPCPGFYLHNIEAFAVSKTQLRPLDESGNYALEVSLMNGSDTAQAVPYLQIELVDDNDGSLLRRTLSPEEYLDKGQKTIAIAPHGQLTVRVSLQTNVTSARCIVTPLYP